MEKFSVKKPFTVLVAVIMVLMLGFVSITKMKTNLLPNVSTPYLMVVTVYPGASPERVETEVSDVLQNALTVPGVSKITATSAENYSLLLMQFVDDTDMDSALVQVSNKLDQAKSDLPETALTPSVIQYSMNMNAFMTVAVSREGSSVYDLSDFIKNTMTPYVQRKGGVSSVSSSGLVEQLVQVQPGDVLLAISFPRYSKMTVNAVQYAREKGADVVAITDSTLAPLYPLASAALLVRSDMISFVDSITAPLSLLNALIVTVGQRKNEEVPETFSELERVWSQYSVFGKTEDE